MFERWLAARDAEAVRSAWTALAPRRHVFSQRGTLTLHGAALLAEAMLGERPDWIVNVMGRPPVFQSRGDVDAAFLDDAWNVTQPCNESWDVYEQRDGTRGVQVVMVGVGSSSGQPDGSSETVVRIFDQDRAASVRIGSNQVATIGEIDLAPLDLLMFSQSHSMPINVDRLLAELRAQLHFDQGLPWGHRLEANSHAIYGQLPSAAIEHVIARIPAAVAAARAAASSPTVESPVSEGMSTKAKGRVWEWDGTGAFHSFNPHYDVKATAEGLEYYVETKGPFCGYDRVGSQSWDEFLAAGPPANVEMPESIAAEVRAHGLALER